MPGATRQAASVAQGPTVEARANALIEMTHGGPTARRVVSIERRRVEIVTTGRHESSGHDRRVVTVVTVVTEAFGPRQVAPMAQVPTVHETNDRVAKDRVAILEADSSPLRHEAMQAMGDRLVNGRFAAEMTALDREGLRRMDVPTWRVTSADFRPPSVDRVENVRFPGTMAAGVHRDALTVLLVGRRAMKVDRQLRRPGERCAVSGPIPAAGRRPDRNRAATKIGAQCVVVMVTGDHAPGSIARHEMGVLDSMTTAPETVSAQRSTVAVATRRSAAADLCVLIAPVRRIAPAVHRDLRRRIAHRLRSAIVTRTGPEQSACRYPLRRARLRRAKSAPGSRSVGRGSSPSLRTNRSNQLIRTQRFVNATGPQSFPRP